MQFSTCSLKQLNNRHVTLHINPSPHVTADGCSEPQSKIRRENGCSALLHPVTAPKSIQQFRCMETAPTWAQTAKWAEGKTKMSVLNITGGSGSFLRYQSSTDQWMCNKSAIQLNTMTIDHGAVKTGWGQISEGSAPNWVWDQQLGNAVPKPSPEHRRGFSARVHVEGYGWLEWATTSSGSTIGFDTIFEQVWNGKDQHADQLAVVKYLGSKPIRIGKGNSRQPMFELIGWTPKSALPDDDGSSGNGMRNIAAPVAYSIPQTPVSGITLPFSN